MRAPVLTTSGGLPHLHMLLSDADPHGVDSRFLGGEGNIV